MRDYSFTVEILRSCAENSCENCPIGGAEYTSKDCRKAHNDAADAIEELLDEVKHWELEAAANETDRNYLIDENRKLVNSLMNFRVPTWISVEERLPEGNGTRYEYELEESNLVLVYGINHIGEMAYGLGRYIYDHDDPKDSGWNGNMECDYDLDYCTVTHWMPLPEPPKEVE